MTSDQIRQTLHNTYPFLQKNDLDLLLQISNYQFFANRELIIKAGQKPKQGFFILKGMIRGYFLNQKGEEKNIFLRPEHTITAAPETLIQGKPTKYNFESILESHLLVMDMEELKRLIHQSPGLTQMFIEGLQENIMTLITRVEALIDKSPEERYQDLLNRSPQFFQKAFHKHIANYLGITAVSLSRIIKRLHHQERGDS